MTTQPTSTVEELEAAARKAEDAVRKAETAALVAKTSLSEAKRLEREARRAEEQRQLKARIEDEQEQYDFASSADRTWMAVDRAYGSGFVVTVFDRAEYEGEASISREDARRLRDYLISQDLG